jgi:hypothetical protein
VPRNAFLIESESFSIKFEGVSEYCVLGIAAFGED